ncbi:MAG: glycosyltransferase [Ruminococcus sp.]|nr:glycosyltransferase [Ruminococcus sp.]
MRRVLILSDTASMQDLYNRSNLNLLIEMDCEIHVGCNFQSGNTTGPGRVKAFCDELEEASIIWHQINFIISSDPMEKEPLAGSEIAGIIEEYDFDLIHCLTPSSLICAGRLAAKKKIPVFFTSFGFPFYDGAPRTSWLRYRQKFKKAVRYADVLICTNKEDYERAKKDFNVKHVYRIPGTGLDPYRFRAPTVDRIQMREQMEIPQNAVTLITIAPLTAEQNHAVILKAIDRLRMLELHYIICGHGPYAENLYQLTERLHLEDRVHFTSHRDDIANLLHACDIFCLPSRREELGMHALEAMEAGLPLVTSNVQIIKDFMEDGKTGYMFPPSSVNGFIAGIEALTEDKGLRKHIGEYNRFASEPFYRENAEYVMRQLYQIQLDLHSDSFEDASEEAADYANV